MLLNIMFYFIFLLSLMFIFMNHPLAMGLMLLILTILISLSVGLMNSMFWFSYILFLVFLGGMLVLFIYITSLASNEMFSLSKKFLLYTPLILIFMMMSVNLTMKIFNFYGILTNFFINHSIYNFSLIKLFSFPSSFLTLALISYLLLTLIVIVNITNIQEGPIRHSY